MTRQPKLLLPTSFRARRVRRPEAALLLRSAYFFLLSQQPRQVFHTFPTTSSVLLSFPQRLQPSQLNRNSVAPHGFGQLQRDAQTAGGHRPYRGRLRQAAESRGAELFGAVSVSQRENTFIFGACDAAVLSLLWM